jgi:hypothetical protein
MRLAMFGLAVLGALLIPGCIQKNTQDTEDGAISPLKFSRG